MSVRPIVPPPRPETLSVALERNIAALAERRRAEARAMTPQARLAEAITRFTGSMSFVCLHLVIYGCWILVNAGLVPFVPRFDPSFVILATEASVEAIFLSTFVLISQNRAAAEMDKRSDLDLQISLLTEHELTKLIRVVTAMAERMGLPELTDDRELQETQEDVAPEAVLDKIEERNRSED
jgi:uncharacterized membrane protein